MFFSKSIIIGDTIEDSEHVLKLLEDGKTVYDTYLLCLSNNEKNIIEILTSTELAKPFYKNKNHFVIAVANSKKESFVIVHNIISDFLKTGQHFKCIKEYIRQLFF